MITIIGVGTGYQTLTIQGLLALRKAQVVIGAGRILEETKEYWEPEEKLVYQEYHTDRIVDIIREQTKPEIAVLVSGDTGFYSLTNVLLSVLEETCKEHSVSVIPGISSVNAFFAKLKMPWEHCAFLSLHGREGNVADLVRRNHLTFVLTGNNIREVAEKLIKTGLTEVLIYVGSNLDHEDELIKKMTPKELLETSCAPLSVLLIENNQYDAGIRCGISDEEFIRGDVPMTKSEVRAGIISKLQIKPDDVCYDIGAGTGSVTVEMALAAWNHTVIAIEKEPDAVAIIHKNLKKFHIGNVEVYQGEAEKVLCEKEAKLQKPDVAFIGGSGGHMRNIIKWLLQKNKDVRIVVSAIALETLQTAMNTFLDMGLDAEMVQISVSRSKKISGRNLMMANNPVYIIYRKCDE